jgi:hypothetical protein
VPDGFVRPFHDHGSGSRAPSSDRVRWPREGRPATADIGILRVPARDLQHGNYPPPRRTLRANDPSDKRPRAHTLSNRPRTIAAGNSAAIAPSPIRSRAL